MPHTHTHHYIFDKVKHAADRHKKQTSYTHTNTPEVGVNIRVVTLSDAASHRNVGVIRCQEEGVKQAATLNQSGDRSVRAWKCVHLLVCVFVCVFNQWAGQSKLGSAALQY